MDWRERTYYWVRLNKSGAAWFEKGHDDYGKEYERRVKELKKIPGLKILPLPMRKNGRVPEWAQMLVSCRKAHEGTLENCLMGFAAEDYGNCMWGRIVEPVKAWLTREKRGTKASEKIEAGDLVRVLDGSCIKRYCGGWTARMKEYVGRTLEVERVINDLFTGEGAKLYLGGGYTWDTRGLELVAKGKVQREPETKAEKAEAKEFKIRNSAGVLTAKVERELNIREVFYGIGDDAIPGMKRPRLEVHAESGHWGGMLVTLSDRESGKDDIMYVIEIPADCYDCKPSAWLCRIGTEQPEDGYVTMEPWREG